MEFEKWIGKYVIVYRINDDRTYPMRVEGWDDEQGRMLLGPRAVSLPAEEILKIVPQEPGHFRRGPSAGIPAAPHSVGYIMSRKIQFDNAIHFQSPVMVWKGSRLIHYRCYLGGHNETEVLLKSGDRLLKQDHLFVVRTMRGNETQV